MGLTPQIKALTPSLVTNRFLAPKNPSPKAPIWVSLKSAQVHNLIRNPNLMTSFSLEEGMTLFLFDGFDPPNQIPNILPRRCGALD